LAAAFNDPQNPATCVVLIGHVPIPYSGAVYRDGHPEHAGAWPADMYYADTDGIWTDTNVKIINYTFPENTNIPSDGKWDNDYAPSPVELAIGRIDFARLPAFGAAVGDVPAPAEIVLLNQYFSKNHNYRNNLDPYPLKPKGVTASTFIHSPPQTYIDSTSYIYNEGARTCSALFGDILQSLVIGDPYEQKSESFLLGFASGHGAADRINAQALFSLHMSSDLANGVIEAPIAFYLLYGSYFGDWNMMDNFMRATIATQNYGLAIMWDLPQSRWRLETMALGNYLGDCWRTMVNDPEYMDSTFGVDHKYRDLAIMGDPTLRLNY